MLLAALGVAAVALILWTVLYPLIFQSSISAPAVEIDAAAGDARLDSRIALELRGSLSPQEVQQSLRIWPAVPIGDEDLQVEKLAWLPWQETLPWMKTRVVINPARKKLFQPDTSYVLIAGPEKERRRVAFSTISVPRLAPVRPRQGTAEDLPVTDALTLRLNERVLWSDRYLSVYPREDLAVRMDHTGKTISIHPLVRPWRNSTTYTLIVDAELPDRYGHPMGGDFIFTFRTAPKVKANKVSPRGRGKPVKPAVEVRFDRAPLKRAAVRSFSIRPDVNGSLKWEDDRTLIWTPEKKLDHSTTYKLSVGGGQSWRDPIVERSWEFRTLGPIKAVKATPTGGSRKLDSTVKIVFERPPDRKAAQQSFKIKPSIDGNFKWPNARTLVWKPRKLRHSTEYKVSVGGGAYPETDSIMRRQWRFKTTDPPVFVRIKGRKWAPDTLKAVARGGAGSYKFRWSTGDRGRKLALDLPPGGRKTIKVTVRSGDRTDNAKMVVFGPAVPCPDGWQTIRRSVCYTQQTLPGPKRVYLARIDLKDPSVQMRSLPARDTLYRAAPVSASAISRGTLVSTNGDFADVKRDGYVPLGAMATAGSMVYLPASTWPALALDSDLRSWVGQSGKIGVKLTPSKGRAVTVRLVNKAPTDTGLALFNAYWGDQLSLGSRGCYAVLAAGPKRQLSVKKRACGNLTGIPLRKGQSVLVGIGEATDVVKNGMKGPLSLSVSSPLRGLDFAVGGSHALIRGGELVGLRADQTLHPRSAIGIDRNGFAYMVVVDGRSATSAGMSLHELQRFLKGFGIVNAVNLDGGGSSTMVVRGTLMNYPSDGSERWISSVVEVVGGDRSSCPHAIVRC